MSFVEVKHKKIFCKQFIRIKKNYLLLNQRNMGKSLVSLFKSTEKGRKVTKQKKKTSREKFL